MRWAALLTMLALAAVAASADAAPPPGGQPIVRTTGGEAKTPSLQLGEELFAANCVRCHGIAGRGVATGPDAGLRGPPLRGVGALAPDFYLSAGYMPLDDAHHQPVRSKPRFSSPEIRAITRYVASLGGGPAIPAPNPRQGSVADGRELFTEHCAGCHQVVAAGGIMPGAKAPPLDHATPRQIAEAVRIGPYTMPTFTTRDITDAQLNSIIAYVQYTKDPQDAGGWGIDHLGPFPEGMVVWLIAIPLLVLICLAIGKRLPS
jgi:ubiquinol-cytochrome c reductase cytochrome c subunit